MTLGIIGGLGPMATAYFMELLTEMTDASCDQEHLEMLIYSRPCTPDRTKFILGKSDDSPLPSMICAGKALVEQGVCCVGIPCITAHYFHDELEKELGIPVLHAPKETAKILKAGGIQKVGIMATDGTVKSELLQKHIAEQGMEPILPSPEMQQLVMSLIYDDVKAGRKPNMSYFKSVRNYLKEQGAEVIILGCTELSVIKKDIGLGVGFIDVLDVLAKTAIERCGKQVKAQYETLFCPF